MENYTMALVEFAAAIKFENLPDSVVEQTKLFIADYYAASFAGYHINKEFNTISMEVIREQGGCEEASILFEQKKYPVCNAAFMNAAYAHGADMDDGNRKAAGHVATHVMPAVFALAEKYEVTWGEVIAAINVGYEFFNRIAGAAQPELYNKGFHSTGVAGSIACAAACARLIGLNSSQLYNSVSLAAIQSSGLIIIDESGQKCKPINPANAAKTGVFSALLAEKGLESSRNPLESKKGWFHAYTNSVNEHVLLNGLGREFTICESYLKLYPTCRHTHSCIDAAIDIRRQISANEIFDINMLKKINVYIYPNAIKSAGTIIFPKSEEEAKFSIHYAISIAFYRGNFSLEDLNPENSGHEIKSLSKKIELITDNSMVNPEKGIRGARVRVVLHDDRIFEKIILIPKGEGSGSLGWDDVKSKMYSCVPPNIEKNIADAIIETCQNLKTDNKFDSMVSCYK